MHIKFVFNVPTLDHIRDLKLTLSFTRTFHVITSLSLSFNYTTFCGSCQPELVLVDNAQLATRGLLDCIQLITLYPVCKGEIKFGATCRDRTYFNGSSDHRYDHIS
jgi:hypothetical protein